LSRPLRLRARQKASNLLPYNHGAVAQLGEHLLCKQGVAGSIPVRSIRGSAVLRGV
jgi:hypothetical protein